MPVYWHNRLELPNADPDTQPTYAHATLEPLIDLV